MRTLAEQIVAEDPTKLPEGETEVTQENYFRIVSLNRLGTEQSAQFQSGDQYGSSWHWGSKCTALGECDSTAAAANNTLAEMPRGYHDSTNALDNYYNYFSATAESGHMGMGSGVVSPDSICPSGWKLANSYLDLARDGGYIESSQSVFNALSALTFRSYPLSFSMSGYYNQNSGILQRSITGRYITSKAFSNDRYSYMYFTAYEGGPAYDMPMDQGASVRCVKN